MRGTLIALVAITAVILPTGAIAQATTRQCGSIEETGPACLLARQSLPSLPSRKIFWHIDRFVSKQAAERARTKTGVVTEAFGAIWLFTLAQKGWQVKGGEHISTIGPLPILPAATYSAEYLRSIFSPGMTAPLHIHSGPEAFYAVTGDTCLETPEGLKIGRGPGNSLLIEAGPPMLLMAIGRTPRQGFALILHDANKLPTTLTHAWHPPGLCARQLLADQES